MSLNPPSLLFSFLNDYIYTYIYIKYIYIVDTSLCGCCDHFELSEKLHVQVSHQEAQETLASLSGLITDAETTPGFCEEGEEGVGAKRRWETLTLYRLAENKLCDCCSLHPWK